jgi:NDP-mannose synthase
VVRKPPIFPRLESEPRSLSDLGGATAVILAGGKGTRLAPYTSVLPKPLMPIDGEPILEIVIEQLERARFQRIVLCVGYLADLIVAVLGNGRPRAASLEYVREEAELGTAGALALTTGLVDTFLVMNGDVLTDLQFDELLRFHRERGNMLTIAGHRRTRRSDYGVLETNGGDRLVAYLEKPEESFHVSMGVYVLEPAVLDFIPQDERFDFPEVVHALLAAGAPCGVFEHEGLWLDIGIHDDYLRAAELWESRKAAATAKAS